MPFKSNKAPRDAAKNVGKKLVALGAEKAQRALRTLTTVIGGNADFYVPVDTNALLNSREIKVVKTEKGYKATLGYYQSYAAYLHGDSFSSPLWKPRPSGTKQKKTGGYNPNATPQWIPRGVKDTNIPKVLAEASKI